MNLTELKFLLTKYSDRVFRIALPDGDAIPISFHVTEVGRVHKTFLDCGGKLRESLICQLQIWVGEDYDHRLETGKMSKILEKASACLPETAIPVEVEYEDKVISQYTIETHELTDGAVVLRLAHKHTECLAPELCGLPDLHLTAIPGKASCGGSSTCC